MRKTARTGIPTYLLLKFLVTLSLSTEEKFLPFKISAGNHVLLSIYFLKDSAAILRASMFFVNDWNLSLSSFPFSTNWTRHDNVYVTQVITIFLHRKFAISFFKSGPLFLQHLSCTAISQTERLTLRLFTSVNWLALMPFAWSFLLQSKVIPWRMLNTLFLLDINHSKLLFLLQSVRSPR